MSATPSIASADIGIIGLGVMGENLALNIDDHGFRAALWNHTEDKLASLMERGGRNRQWVPTRSLAQFVDVLARPRRILLMITAGSPVDQTLERLAPLLSPDDMVIDGGNSFFADTQRRELALRGRGVRFVSWGSPAAQKAHVKARR